MSCTAKSLCALWRTSPAYNNKSVNIMSMHRGSGDAPADPAVERALQKLSARASSYYRQGQGSCTENRCQVSTTQDTVNTTSKRRHAETTSAGLLPSEGPRSSKCGKLREGIDQEGPREKGSPRDANHAHSTDFEDARVINGLLVRAKCASDLLKVLEDKSTRFDGVNVSTMLHRLAKQPDGRKVMSENEAS